MQIAKSTGRDSSYRTQNTQPGFNNLLFILFLFFIVTFQIQAGNSLFSPFNRYEFSNSQFLLRRQQMRDTTQAAWLSLFDTCAQIHCTTDILFSAKEQSLNFGFAALGAFEYFSKSSRFGIVQGNVDYATSFLKAHINANVYTTEQKSESPVNDILYERFIKTGAKEPISGLFDFRFNLPEAYIETRYKLLRLSIGKQKLRWGPGYKGTLGLSGVAYSPFYFYTSEIL